MRATIEDFMRVRFPSPEAALGFDALVLGTVSTLSGISDLILGSSRAVVLAPGLNTNSDRSIRYLSNCAHRYAIRMGARHVAEERVSKETLPSGLVLVIGLERDRPQFAEPVGV